MKTKDILLSPVRKVETKSILPGYETASDNEYAVIINVGGIDKILNFCSKNYEVLENQFVMNSFEGELKAAGIKYKKRYHQSGWSKFFIDYCLNLKEYRILPKDIIIPKIRVVNSYDGKLRLQTSFGFHRLVCSNGMTVPMGKTSSQKITHTPSLYSDTGFNKVVSDFDEFVTNAKDYLKPYELLKHQTVKKSKLVERIQEVIEATSFPKRQAEAVLSKINEELVLLQIKEPTDWIVYNGFNNLLNHNRTEIRMAEEKRTQVDLEILNHLLA